MSPWFRFEGPGKLHSHRWHRVKRSPSGHYVTYCGRYVWGTPVKTRRRDGADCVNCQRAAQRASGQPEGQPYG